MECVSVLEGVESGVATLWTTWVRGLRREGVLLPLVWPASVVRRPVPLWSRRVVPSRTRLVRGHGYGDRQGCPGGAGGSRGRNGKWFGAGVTAGKMEAVARG